MYKYIILLWISLCVCVQCDLNKAEGDECEWEGVKGTCVDKNRCLTTLERHSEHLVCSEQGEKTIVCCTDCELVNDTSNAVFAPHGGILWKDGSKARDNCLNYLDELPYTCRDGGFYAGIGKHLDEEKKCHRYSIWAIGGAPPPGSVPGPEYPHQVLLGYGKSLKTVAWLPGGVIISNRYILTSASLTATQDVDPKDLNFVALGVLSRSDIPSWQVLRVKRFIAHPEYKASEKYYDIGLIETETPIIFNKNVLPACLPFKDESETAVLNTWRDLKSDTAKLADSIEFINMEKFSTEECEATTSFDDSKQLCYGRRSQADKSCLAYSGEPLLATPKFAHCIYSVIGLSSLHSSNCGANIFTKVSAFVPWIESIVWA